MPTPDYCSLPDLLPSSVDELRPAGKIRVLPGDFQVTEELSFVPNGDGSRSVFPLRRPDEEIRGRPAEGDLHPGGPLWGKGDPDSGGDTAKMESRLAIEYPKLTSDLAVRGMTQERRALRVIPKYLRWKTGADEITLEFFLCRGAYATGLLRELVDYTDIQAPL